MKSYYQFDLKKSNEPSMVTHTCNPNPWMAEAGQLYSCWEFEASLGYILSSRSACAMDHLQT